MSKKGNVAKSTHYEYIKAFVDSGNLSWEWRMSRGRTETMIHDEDISSFSEWDIIRLTKNILCVDRDDPVDIEVVYL